MVPLIGTIQMQGATLMALDEKIVSKADQSQVLSILQQSGSPQNLANKIRESKDKTEAVWKATLDLAEKMEKIRTELKLPETL